MIYTLLIYRATTCKQKSFQLHQLHNFVIFFQNIFAVFVPTSVRNMMSSSESLLASCSFGGVVLPRPNDPLFCNAIQTLSMNTYDIQALNMTSKLLTKEYSPCLFSYHDCISSENIVIIQTLRRIFCIQEVYGKK